jgi:hypothetical protein
VWPALLNKAVKRVDFNEVRQLCSADAILVHDRIDSFGGTALHVACWGIKNGKDAAKMAAMLLDEFHANMEATNKAGDTPALVAADRGG